MNVFSEYHRRYIFKIGAIILLSSIVLIGLNFYSIKILSSIRAYVNGESQYSKGQKDATRHLINFIQTSDPKAYTLFKYELSAPIGDSLARVALQKGKSYDVVRQAALQGRNHPDDIGNMIWLFECFQHFPYFKDVILKWTAADRDIGELEKIGLFIYQLKSRKLHPAVKAGLILNVNTINRRLTNNQQAFSTILGEASRVVAGFLMFINVFFILFILITSGIFAKNMFRRLVDSQKLIMEQNNAKDEFLSIASHELKTPLTSMKASIQILERIVIKHPESIEMHPFIKNSHKQVNRLTDLVKDLLDVTKIQNGKLIINKNAFLLNELITDVVNETTHASQHIYILEDLPRIYVNADASRIYQVIDNFLSNASKYSQAGKEIIISSEIVKNEVKISVRDFGPGIPKNKISHLFDRFYRVDEKNNTVQGLGLGLYICNEIIKNHGGKIGAESEVGRGSQFWFSLPIVKVLDTPKVKPSHHQLSSTL